MYEMHLYLLHSSCVYIFQPKSRVSTIIACISSKHHHQTYISLWEIKPQQNAQSVMFDIFISKTRNHENKNDPFWWICYLYAPLLNAIYLGISIYTIFIFCICFAVENHNYLTRNILQRQATLLFCSPGNSSWIIQK